MRRIGLFRVSVFFLLLAAAYIAWPLYTVLTIREAMRSGDTATLSSKVEWDSVRASLKASMSAEALAALETEPGAPKPTLWQRVKSTIAPSMAGNVVDRYATPEHLPVFLGYRRIWRGTLQPVIARADPPTALAGTWLDGTVIDRFVAFYGRIRRAVFHSLTRFEIEVADRHRLERSYTGILELKGLEWKLTSLTISGAIAAPKVINQP
jgi:Protein of unknown function (DUF2939)